MGKCTSCHLFSYRGLNNSEYQNYLRYVLATTLYLIPNSLLTICCIVNKTKCTTQKKEKKRDTPSQVQGVKIQNPSFMKI